MGSSVDHVFPRAIFSRPFPPDLITVPACRTCQNRKAQGEGDLRDLLASHYASTDHPNAEGLMTKLGGAIQTNRTQLVRTFDQGHRVVRPSRTGLVLPDLYAVPFDFEALYQTMHMVVQGLYFRETGFRLGASEPIELSIVPEADRERQLWEFAARILEQSWRDFGNGVVRWMPAFNVMPGQEPTDSIWIIVFHRGVVWVAQTGDGVAVARELRAKGQAERDDAERKQARLSRLNLVTGTTDYEQDRP